MQAVLVVMLVWMTQGKARAAPERVLLGCKMHPLLLATSAVFPQGFLILFPEREKTPNLRDF